MKDPYTKPLFGMELFSLTQTMASSCTSNIPKIDLTLNDIATCAWDMGGGNRVFIEPPTCTINGEGSGFVCYHNPGEGSYIFRS